MKETLYHKTAAIYNAITIFIALFTTLFIFLACTWWETPAQAAPHLVPKETQLSNEDHKQSRFQSLGKIRTIVEYEPEQTWLKKLCTLNNGKVFKLAFARHESCAEASAGKAPNRPKPESNAEILVEDDSQSMFLKVSFGQDSQFLTFQVTVSQGSATSTLLKERFATYADWQSFMTEPEFTRIFSNLISDALGVWSTGKATPEEESKFVAEKELELKKFKRSPETESENNWVKGNVQWNARQLAFQINDVVALGQKTMENQFILNMNGRIYFREFLLAELGELMIRRTRKLALERKLTTVGIGASIGFGAEDSIAYQTTFQGLFRFNPFMAAELNVDYLQLQIQTALQNTIETETPTESSVQSIEQQLRYGYQEFQIAPSLRFSLLGLPNSLSGLFTAFGFTLFTQKFVPTQVAQNQSLADSETENSFVAETRETSDFAPVAQLGFEYLSDVFMFRNHNRYIRALSTGFIFERIESNFIAGLPLLRILPIPLHLVSSEESNQWSSKFLSGIKYSGTEFELNKSNNERISKVGITMNTLSFYLGLEFSL